jgi:hypothetical protein
MWTPELHIESSRKILTEVSLHLDTGTLGSWKWSETGPRAQRKYKKEIPEGTAALLK